MEEQFERTAILIGERGVERLKNSSVALIGLGGVGGFCAEALVRAGVGKLLFVDGDVVSLSNINRQIIALHSTVGQKKSALIAWRALQINPNAEIEEVCAFIDGDNVGELNLSRFDYVADAIDSVEAKADLIEHCTKSGIRIISCMGAGNRLDTNFEIADIYETHSCGLAKTMRKILKERGVRSLKTVFSPAKPHINSAKVGSISFIPSIAGLTMASEIIKDIIKD